MVTAAVLFQPGWVAVTAGRPGEVDQLTGETLPAEQEETIGRGLLQAPLWTGFSEVTETTVVDERMVLFTPPIKMCAEDSFFSPEGECWQAITEGMPRGIPGQPPEYVAVRVRHAPELDKQV